MISRWGATNAVGLALVLVFAFCGAGAVSALVVPERYMPALLAWTGSLAALAGVCAAGIILHGGAFHGSVWTIGSLGTIGISLDRLSAFFLLIAAIVVLASSVFSAS